MTEPALVDRAGVHAPQPVTPRSARLTALVACLGILVAYLPVAGVSVVLGAIAKDTGADTADLQWVSAAYVLAMAAAVLSAGVLGDLFGRKRVLVFGFGFTVVGALIGFVAGFLDGSASIHLLWAGQAVMGVGGGALLTSTLALISHAFTDQHQRTHYIAFWASALVVGAGVGPFVTGAVVAAAPWNWIFVPLGALALVMVVIAALTVEESSFAHGRRLDLAGQITGILAVTGLVYGIIEGGASGWGSPASLTGLGGGAVMIVAFIVTEHRAPSPLMRLELFRSAGFSVAAVTALVALFSVVGIVFVLSIYFGTVEKLTVLEIAERTAFFFALAAIFGPIAARLQKRVAARVPLVIGLVVASAGSATLTGISESSSLIDVGWRLALAGAGVGMVLSTVSSVAINSVPRPLAGMAGATNTLFRQFGAVLGPAVLGTVIAARTAAGADLTDALHVSGIVVSAAFAATALICAVVLFSPLGTPKKF